MILRIEHYFGNIIFYFFQDIAPDELISINVLKKTTTEKKPKKEQHKSKGNSFDRM